MESVLDRGTPILRQEETLQKIFDRPSWKGTANKKGYSSSFWVPFNIIRIECHAKGHRKKRRKKFENAKKFYGIDIK